ncbi:MAG: hypothetical protein MK077_10670 [Phycisphaerales bacterium]|nr:hypothetical protein [Phycisphaerales bacterium]
MRLVELRIWSSGGVLKELWQKESNEELLQMVGRLVLCGVLVCRCTTADPLAICVCVLLVAQMHCSNTWCCRVLTAMVSAAILAGYSFEMRTCFAALGFWAPLFPQKGERKRTCCQLRGFVQTNLAELQVRSGDSVFKKLRASRSPEEKRWYSWMSDVGRTDRERAEMEELNVLVAAEEASARVSKQQQQQQQPQQPQQQQQQQQQQLLDGNTPTTKWMVDNQGRTMKKRKQCKAMRNRKRCQKGTSSPRSEYCRACSALPRFGLRRRTSAQLREQQRQQQQQRGILRLARLLQQQRRQQKQQQRGILKQCRQQQQRQRGILRLASLLQQRQRQQQQRVAAATAAARTPLFGELFVPRL